MPSRPQPSRECALSLQIPSCESKEYYPGRGAYDHTDVPARVHTATPVASGRGQIDQVEELVPFFEHLLKEPNQCHDALSRLSRLESDHTLRVPAARAGMPETDLNIKGF